jgi:Nif-specific regulatory protein
VAPALTPDPLAFLAQAARLLQDEEPFPTVVQRVLALVEELWAPLRGSLSLGDQVVLVTGQSEFPDRGTLNTVPVVRGTRAVGSLTFEVPHGTRSAPLPPPGLQEALAALVAQESEVRRWAGTQPVRQKEWVGASGLMQEVLRLVERVAPTRQPVLFIGEPGVGKARMATLLHRLSAVSQGPFVVFNGTALPESMAEGELFGHPRGGGGRIAEARGGTLFLEEIGDLSLAVQGRLVKALAAKDAPRIAASTRRDLESLVAAGRFRADLHGRFADHRIVVPPLRDRGSDIIALADQFVAGSSLETGKEIKRISTPTLEMLLTYPWPGNVRELENVMERAVLMSDDEVIHGYHLPPSLQSSVHSGTRMHGRLTDRLDSLEYEMLVEALKASQGNVTQAARELGLTKRVMGLRMKKFELDYRPFRQGPADLAEDDDWN